MTPPSGGTTGRPQNRLLTGEAVTHQREASKQGRVGASYRVMSKASETIPFPRSASLVRLDSVSVPQHHCRPAHSGNSARLVGWFLISSDWGGFGAMHPTPQFLRPLHLTSSLGHHPTPTFRTHAAASMSVVLLGNPSRFCEIVSSSSLHFSLLSCCSPRVSTRPPPAGIVVSASSSDHLRC
ncbi:hypothetical protein LZ31DRAFT_69686 [Colletotrichum somersetense]|nr:hypothetical protein LZ31DRAFT_69686 [Colletotrichum somersetense]